jgi:putative endonuclease
MNARVGSLEVDILARDGDAIVVVEVRARGPRSFQAPLESISPRKRERLRKAGQRLWAERFERDPTVNTLRFDAVGVAWDRDGSPAVTWVRGAF